MGRQKRYSWAVTFESATRPPDTIRGEIVAGTPRKAVSTAVAEASRRRTIRTWSSLVVLLQVEDVKELTEGA